MIGKPGLGERQLLQQYAGTLLPAAQQFQNGLLGLAHRQTKIHRQNGARRRGFHFAEIDGHRPGKVGQITVCKAFKAEAVHQRVTDEVDGTTVISRKLDSLHQIEIGADTFPGIFGVGRDTLGHQLSICHMITVMQC